MHITVATYCLGGSENDGGQLPTRNTALYSFVATASVTAVPEPRSRSLLSQTFPCCFAARCDSRRLCWAQDYQSLNCTSAAAVPGAQRRLSFFASTHPFCRLLSHIMFRQGEGSMGCRWRPSTPTPNRHDSRRYFSVPPNFLKRRKQQARSQEPPVVLLLTSLNGHFAPMILSQKNPGTTLRSGCVAWRWLAVRRHVASPHSRKVSCEAANETPTTPRKAHHANQSSAPVQPRAVFGRRSRLSCSRPHWHRSRSLFFCPLCKWETVTMRVSETHSRRREEASLPDGTSNLKCMAMSGRCCRCTR